MVNKRDSNDPRQLSLFGEIPSSSNPSIATFPEFDQALNNLIKLSDLGAFIEINIQGFEKSYTLNLSESIIPKDFLKIPKNYSPITVQLFSHDLRNELKKLTCNKEIILSPKYEAYIDSSISEDELPMFQPIKKKNIALKFIETQIDTKKSYKVN